MDRSLYDLLTGVANNEENAMLQIIYRFMPLIKMYSRKLAYDGAESDLIINIIKITKLYLIYNYINLEEEGKIVSYIVTSTKHEYIRLSKKFANILKTEVSLDENTSTLELNDNHEEYIFVKELLDKLPNSQRDILKKIFVYGYSEKDLAIKLNISRQTRANSMGLPTSSIWNSF